MGERRRALVPPRGSLDRHGPFARIIFLGTSASVDDVRPRLLDP
jgi:hypothetical protein